MRAKAEWILEAVWPYVAFPIASSYARPIYFLPDDLRLTVEVSHPSSPVSLVRRR